MDFFLQNWSFKVCIIRLFHMSKKKLRRLFDKYAVARTEDDALVKSTMKIFSNFMAFSENPNFNITIERNDLLKMNLCSFICTISEMWLQKSWSQFFMQFWRISWPTNLGSKSSGSIYFRRSWNTRRKNWKFKHQTVCWSKSLWKSSFSSIQQGESNLRRLWKRYCCGWFHIWK